MTKYGYTLYIIYRKLFKYLLYIVIAVFDSFEHCAALFLDMGAVGEAAFALVFFKLRKAACELIFENNIVSVRIKRGKAGSIGNISAAWQLI